jgi:hypothetical protein
MPNYCAECDFNNDGKVELVDFGMFSSHYNHECDCGGKSTCGKFWTGEKWVFAFSIA